LGIVAINLEGQVMEIPPLLLALYRDDFDGQNTGFRWKRRGTIAS